MNSPIHIENPDIDHFETLYLPLREKEGRVYSDRELAQLPEISTEHIHYAEWQLRKKSCERLVKYLAAKQQSLKILEVGCGNGWLANQLSQLPQARVTGCDINLAELQQAMRVFDKQPNLQFVLCDIRSDVLKNAQFDIIVFAASIQYFPSVPEIVGSALQLLKQNGEIHILDSPFYSPGEAERAKQRTLDYYKKMGFPEMSRHYFHHSIADLDLFNYRILFKPALFARFFPGPKNMFTWTCIKK